MRVTRRRMVLLGVIVAIAIVAALAFRPHPVVVQTVPVSRAALLTTVDEDGVTRVPERFEVSSPIAGRQARIQVHAGDMVKTGDLLVEVDPLPIDPRRMAELTAQKLAAEEHAREADATVRKVSGLLAQARRDRLRAEKLAAAGIAARADLEQLRTAESDHARELESATFRAHAAEYDVQVVRAGLSAAGGTQALQIRSPIAGRVLRVTHESEGVVAAGVPLLELGDLSRLEVVIDVLSTEAVNVRPGQTVLVDRWGGRNSLRAVVRRVEPSAFTKVSVLGVEEQRVNVIAEIPKPPPQLGDQFQVDARIVVAAGDAVQTPNTALFRHGDQWAVLAVRNGRAHLQPVVIGRRNSTETEIVRGLDVGSRIIVHPSDQVGDGVRVVAEP